MDNMNIIDCEQKAYSFIIMLYITMMLAANIVVYKLISFGAFTFSAGIFVIPCVHVILDIISEKYGYNVTKKIIWYGLTCQLIFALICTYLILLPSPSYWNHQSDYNQVLGKLVRVFMGSFLGTILGSLINAKLITTWKILVQGKYFWLRSIGSSAIGELIFSIVTITYDMYGVQPFHTIISIIVPSYCLKLLFTCIAATPAALIVATLNIYEKPTNSEVNFNPFISTSKT